MTLCPWKTPPSSTTSVFDVMLPVDAAAAREVRLALHDDVALEAPGHAHVLRADVGLDLGLRGQGDVAVGVDLPLDLAVDPEAPGRHDVALEPRAGSDDRDLSVLRHVRILSVSGPRGDRHVAASASSRRQINAPPPARSSPIACRIASSSSSERL